MREWCETDYVGTRWVVIYEADGGNGARPQHLLQRYLHIDERWHSRRRVVVIDARLPQSDWDPVGCQSVGYTPFPILNAYFYLLNIYLAAVGGDYRLALAS